MPDKAAFVERLKAGDPGAIDEMVKAELGRIYNLCLRLSHNPTDAEDLSQETFVHAVRALPDFKGESQISTWLYRIAVNVWKNRVRYDHRRQAPKHVSLSGPADPDDDKKPIEIASPERAPEEWAAIGEDHRILMRAMSGLDDDDRTVLVLRDVEDRPYEEVAMILEMNLGTLKSKISRARDKLRIAYRRLGGSIA